MRTNKQPRRPVEPAPEPEPEVTPPSAEDLAFEREIMARNPGRRITRFDFPDEIEEARAVYLFELKAKDELAAADMADATMTDAERKSLTRAMEAERREAIRLSIVGLVENHDGEVLRRHIDQAEPFMDVDDWSSRAWAALRSFFGEVNAVSVEAMGKALRGARRLGAASALPATQRRAVTAAPSDG